KLYLSNRLGEGFELTPEQQKKMDRYKFIYDQLSSGKYTEQEIVSQLTNKNLYALSLSQAYEDMRCSREIFSSIINVNRTFEVKLQLDINRNLQRKAIELGDMKAAAAFEKNRALLLKLLPEEDESPADAFEGHIFEAVFDPRLLGAPDVDMKEVLRVINEKRNKKIEIDLFEDIPFEDKPNDTDPDSLQQTSAKE
ncbi:MAG TPA: hypothetical protein VEB42_05400, partial [Chitinophagaceae bacterium]|nr:hypothetical protein [Chitinophagaceae bacterium]